MYSTRPTVTRFKILRFLAMRVPMVLFAGVKPTSITDTQCSVSITRNWRNRNPYNATYFAAVETAGEMAAGLMLFDEVQVSNEWTHSKLSVAIMETHTTFRKPVDKHGALVVCRDGLEIHDAVATAKRRRMTDVTTTSEVLDPANMSGKPMAVVTIRWRIIRHRATSGHTLSYQSL